MLRTQDIRSLPLVIFPGAGSERYRGLGAVILGGIFFSTLITLVQVPLLLGLCVRAFPVRWSDAVETDDDATREATASLAPAAAERVGA